MMAVWWDHVSNISDIPMSSLYYTREQMGLKEIYINDMMAMCGGIMC